MVLYFHRNPITYEIFYVGIASEKGRCQRPYAATNRNNYWYHTVRKYGRPIVQIVQTNLNDHIAFKWERHYIKLLGKKTEGGQLVNLSDGGEFNEGFKRSDEAKAKDSIRAKKRGTSHMLTKEARQKVADKNRINFKGKFTGKDNPNYDNKWTTEMKEHMRKVKLGSLPTQTKVFYP